MNETTKNQRHEIEAWLAEGHGLTADQVDELIQVADDIDTRYLGEDNADLREAALIAAFRLMAGHDTVVGDLATDLVRARISEQRALAGLRQAAITLVRPGGTGIESEQGFGRAAGVDRMTVRSWLGK